MMAPARPKLNPLTGNIQMQLRDDAKAVSDWLTAYFDAHGAAADQLTKAMAYAVLNGGKRMRAGLVLSGYRLAAAGTISGKIAGKIAGTISAKPHDEGALRVAAAIEMVHAYSLIHDDLPAMDDADTRRGQPATHIAFDEASAILAGDALQSEAFDLLSRPETHSDAAIRIQLVRLLASGAGLSGMAGGQMLDLAAETKALSLDETKEMQALKTGALIRASALMGGCIGEGDAAVMSALDHYATALGLMFQLVDDLLDYEGDSDKLGKPAGQDEARGKASYVQHYGLAGARQKAEELLEQSLGYLANFGEEADDLRTLARYTINRSY